MWPRRTRLTWSGLRQRTALYPRFLAPMLVFVSGILLASRPTAEEVVGKDVRTGGKMGPMNCEIME